MTSAEQQILGALVAGQLKAGELAALPSDALTPEAAALSAHLVPLERRSGGVDLRGAQRELDPSTGAALAQWARSAPRRPRALRALAEIRAEHDRRVAEAEAEEERAAEAAPVEVVEVEPEPEGEAPAVEPAPEPAPDAPLFPLLARALPGCPWEPRGTVPEADIGAEVERARRAWEKPRTVVYGGPRDLKRGENRRY